MNICCFQVTTIKTVKQMEDLVDMGDGAAWYEKWRIKLSALFHQVMKQTLVYIFFILSVAPLLSNNNLIKFSLLASGFICSGSLSANAACLFAGRVCLSARVSSLLTRRPSRDSATFITGRDFAFRGVWCIFAAAASSDRTRLRFLPVTPSSCVSLQVWSNFQTVFSPQYRRTTYMMMAVWFSMSFR